MTDEKKEAEKYPQPKPVIVDNKMYDKPQVAPDGHVTLSAEDIKNRV